MSMKCIDFGSAFKNQCPSPPWDNPESECYGCKTHSIFDCKKCTICVYKAKDEPSCHMCPAFNSCIYSAVDNLTVRCVHYGQLKSRIDKAIDKLCSVKEVNSTDEIKE